MTSSASSDLQRALATLFVMTDDELAEVIELANRHIRREGQESFEILMAAELRMLNVQPPERAAELARAVATIARAYAIHGTAYQLQ